MKNWVLGFSLVLNLVLLGVLVFLNERYGLWAKAQLQRDKSAYLCAGAALA